jgi:phage terminase small subunit
MCPARKPIGLKTKHLTAAEKQAGARDEESMKPKRGLPKNPPARLSGHKVAEATWRQMMREWSNLEAVIVTRLDLDHLLDYCLLMEQVTQFDQMRDVAYQIWLDLSQERQKLLDEKQLDAALAIGIEAIGAYDAITKSQVRAERIRTMLKLWRESLYLTPRARAGTAPAQKKAEDPDLDDIIPEGGFRLEDLLDGYEDEDRD